jgi:hypothetical protein
MKRAVISLLLALSLVACSTTSNIGLMTRPTSEPLGLLSGNTTYKEVGFVTGQACRYFLIALIPWGDSTPAAAMDEALALSGGDALINVSVTTSLYGFVPIYNVFSFSCTTVHGVAVSFETEPLRSEPE